jgi:thiamine monophosphate synthase
VEDLVRELAFWERHDVPWDGEAQWEEVPGPVVAIGGTKPKAIRVVLPPSQEARLGRIARERRISKAKALEAMIGEALAAPARAARRKRAAGA